MARIMVFTDDKRLFRLVSLLLTEEGHEVTVHAPSLVITDTRQLPTRLSALPCLYIGEEGLARPFSHAEFKEQVEALLSHSTHPLFSPTEERLYAVLKKASPDFVAREVLSRAAFGEEEDGGRLNLYIHYLRKKIETDGKKRIFAHRGKGYSLIC